jgi:hypothetical protein
VNATTTRTLSTDAYRTMMLREVARPEGALAWLEKVGCWQSDDPTTRAITAAAERTMNYSRRSR